jgi:hypothetical protein
MVGVECKRSDAPGMTASIRIALDDLKLDAVAVIYPGSRRFSIAPNVEVVPLSDVAGGELFDSMLD